MLKLVRPGASATDPVLRVRGVGPRSAEYLAALGIRNVVDLVEHLPRTYERYGRPQPIASLTRPTPEPVLVCGQIPELVSRRSFRKRLSIQEGLLSDESGSISVVWFNQPYLAQDLPGKVIFLRGRVRAYRGRLTLESPEVIRDRSIIFGTAPLQPIYPLTGKLTTKQLRYWIKNALAITAKMPDLLPPYIRLRHALLERRAALQQLHFPSSAEELAAARRRMTFEELFLLSLFVLRERHALSHVQARPVPIQPQLLQEFVRRLPYKLTEAQRKAAWQILQDMARPRPMNRLLEGDVGSGKTVVAAMALLATARVGGQAVLLAPTVILAEQHAATLRNLLAPFNVGVGLLAGPRIEIGQGRSVSRATFLAALKSGKLPVTVATHSAFNDSVLFKRLQLVVVDEQHRFGVKQRQLLKTKVRLPNHLPHLLSMTATPIPRSLALTLYGDLDLSILDQKPPGRAPIATKIIVRTQVDKLFDEIKQRLEQAEQVFILYPLIEASTLLKAKAVTEELPALQKKLVDTKIGLLHGRLAETEKNAVMQDFRRGAVQVLAATPVVEVGIDIPNATAMVIMSADRFGLAQLHQLRGRVGRGTKPSVCYLCPDAANEQTRKRLELVCNNSDGFKLAE
ncbi:MAG: ATP-dependent DNA helicase RecG, partial [Parcubacteria group bacterium]